MPAGWPATGWPPEPTAERRLAVAAHMMTYTLRNWVKPRLRRNKDTTAFFERGGETDIASLTQWVELLARNFPRGHAELQGLLGKLQAHSGDELCVAEWLQWLQPLEAKYGPEPLPAACSTETCKVWTLFHVLSLAPGEGHEGALPATETVSRIMAFVEAWFTCRHCRDLAMQQWAARAYGRNRLIKDPRKMPIWLWRLHNAVSVRVAAERGCANIDWRWPPADACPACWKRSVKEWAVLGESARLLKPVGTGYSAPVLFPATPNETAVYAYLAGAFWEESRWDARLLMPARVPIRDDPVQKRSPKRVFQRLPPPAWQRSRAWRRLASLAQATNQSGTRGPVI